MGLPYLPELLTQVAYSLPYLDSTLGLVVRDELRDEFASAARLAGRSPVTIALLGDLPAVQDRLREQLAGVDLRFVALSSPKDFFEGKAPQVDAFAMLAEAGAAWSILYPAYSVVVPQPGAIAVPVGVGMRRGDHRARRRGQRLARDPAQRRCVESGARLLGARARRPEEQPPLVDPPRRAGLGPPCGQAGSMIPEHGGAER